MPFEFSILECINEYLTNSPFFNQIMRFFTFIGDKGWVWIILGIILICIKKTRRLGLIYFISLASGAIINETIKHIFLRTRPIYVSGHEDLLAFSSSWLSTDGFFSYFVGLPKTTSYSFPSGHTYSSFNCATIIFLSNKKYGVMSYVVASLIAFSRMFFAVHFPSDVLVGILLGGGTACLTTYLSRQVMRKQEAKKSCALTNS